MNLIFDDRIRDYNISVLPPGNLSNNTCYNLESQLFSRIFKK